MRHIQKVLKSSFAIPSSFPCQSVMDHFNTLIMSGCSMFMEPRFNKQTCVCTHVTIHQKTLFLMIVSFTAIESFSSAKISYFSYNILRTFSSATSIWHGSGVVSRRCVERGSLPLVFLSYLFFSLLCRSRVSCRNQN